MPSKTVTFNFLKKIELKFDEANTGFKLGKKKIYGIQLLEFDIHFGLRDSKNLTYLCIPVKIVKDEIKKNLKGNNLEIEGSLKFKLNVQDKHIANFEKAIKEKSLIFRSFGLNTTNTPGMEYAVFQIVKSDVKKTKKFLDVTQ
tara:strand:- start:1128 stop:1556 length:429 start_codon:yes stop_codon:yes gene_type:complete